ncbi:hypothetical protein ACWT_5474 [Actinoplanes sp. SE50]|nr:hypothetical protein ACPL_5604 [Actinoplanes sp. SE50/110]ATO84889.1 hypothetical protein ACWT_5474 [Actinoplanes sp. SE50]SLM02298.1 hypothetical protein ACSP50_5537 [Actinoplanes sp. SE50/110]
MNPEPNSARPKHPHSRHRRRMFAVVAGIAVAVGVGGGVAMASGVPFAKSDTSGGMCARTLSAQADLSEPTGGFDPKHPSRACAQGWHQMWGDGTPVPARFVACYHPGANAGGSVIYPADRFADAAAACASIGSTAIPGVKA